MSCKVFLTHPNAKDESYVENALHLDENHKKRYDLKWDAEAPDMTGKMTEYTAYLLEYSIVNIYKAINGIR